MEVMPKEKWALKGKWRTRQRKGRLLKKEEEEEDVGERGKGSGIETEMH